MNETDTRNIAETLADVLPKAQLLTTIDTDGLVPGIAIHHYAVPKGAQVVEMKSDLEHYLANPRKTKATAMFGDHTSFLNYVAKHATEHTVAWCVFNPQVFTLQFMAVIDEHAKGTAGWRLHRARFDPDMSAEWKVWKAKDGSSMDQLPFAEFLQEHDDDINSSAEGMPTSLQMLQMATEFEANQERKLKSTVRLQGGGVRLSYVADADAGTVESMKIFEKFALGIPIFHGCSPWGMTARLKYRQREGAVKFYYELVRPDRVYDHAAMELINQVREGLGGVPLLMGGIEA